MEVQERPRQDPDRASHKEMGDMQEDSSGHLYIPVLVLCGQLVLSVGMPLSSLGLPGRTKGSNRSRTGERPVVTQSLVRTTLS